jgi:multicomponent Na+:H+ antiporter subunit D
VTAFHVPERGATAANVWLPILLLLAIVIVLGVQPEPMMQLAGKGAGTLIDPTGYIRSVLGVAAQ